MIFEKSHSPTTTGHFAFTTHFKPLPITLQTSTNQWIQAKTCNNLLHWIHCVANFETLAIAKRYGVDAQRMREVLLKCPGDNGTLRRWDSTRFTWQEKDMDFVVDLAQNGGLVLPLSAQVDQLIKTLTAADVAALLYGPECTYLGRRVAPLARADGGL